MRFRARCGFLVGALVAIAACVPSMIPGTDVPDTTTNRKLLNEVEVYRQAVERRDAKAVLALVSSKYFDERGHPDDPSYHWDYTQLSRELTDQFARIRSMRLAITVRRVEVKGTHAQVSYLFTENYLAQLPAGQAPEHSSDINRMEFDKVGDKWLITKGL